jgi:hypothetical protein
MISLPNAPGLLPDRVTIRHITPAKVVESDYTCAVALDDAQLDRLCSDIFHLYFNTIEQMAQNHRDLGLDIDTPGDT